MSSFNGNNMDETSYKLIHFKGDLKAGIECEENNWRYIVLNAILKKNSKMVKI